MKPRNVAEAQVHRYVRSLAVAAGARQAAGAAGAADAQQAQPEHQAAQTPQSPEPDSPDTEPSDFGLNPGSLGHPELCQRPCVHVAVGRWCEASNGCDFCHFHHGFVMKLDRAQRRIVEEMSKAAFLTVAIQVLRDKAQAAGLRGTETLLVVSLGLDRRSLWFEASRTVSCNPRSVPNAVHVLHMCSDFLKLEGGPLWIPNFQDPSQDPPLNSSPNPCC